jgi:peptidoglycan/LPS O-acetylase OafA/YrhL
LHRLGRVSYGIYLYHLIVLDLCLRLVTPNGPISQALLLALTIGLSWLVAELSFRVMEAPIMRLRKRFGAH